jgi:hypothetical protein
MDDLPGCNPTERAKTGFTARWTKCWRLNRPWNVMLSSRWQDLFGGDTQVFLYDLTSTYFEGEAERVEQAVHGYSRDHRPDGQQVVLALRGHDRGTAADLPVVQWQKSCASSLQQIITAFEDLYGRTNRLWVVRSQRSQLKKTCSCSMKGKSATWWERLVIGSINLNGS